MGWRYIAIAGVFVRGIARVPGCYRDLRDPRRHPNDRGPAYHPMPRLQPAQMRQTNGIFETYPTGRGTGSFYLCGSCGGRWFWSNDDRGWVDASSPDLAWAFVDSPDDQA